HAMRFIRDEDVVWILIDEDARKKKELPASFVKLSDEALWMMVREVEVMTPFKNELHPRRAERLPMTLFHLASDLRFEEPAWKETLIASVRAMAQQKHCACTVTVNGGREATIHDGRENYFMLTPVSSTRDEYPDVRIAQRTVVNGRDIEYGEVVLCGHMVNTLLSPVTLPALDA
ncbi:hypothetical protein HYV72_01130, partial [Candidatus Uhrbacteria bacterium]|nr:hypothetical protein [Candidatus Uhrbacteria bacterium]